MPTDDIVIPISLLNWEMNSQDRRNLATGNNPAQLGLHQKVGWSWGHVMGLGLRLRKIGFRQCGPKIGLDWLFTSLLLDNFDTAELLLGSYNGAGIGCSLVPVSPKG